MSAIFGGDFDTKQKRRIGDVRTVFNHTVDEYGLIAEGDRIAVGLSGGKDSLTLLHLLAFRKQVLKTPFDFHAVYVNVQNANYSIDLDNVQKFCDNLGVLLIIKNLILNDERDGENRCYVCSRTRRKVLFDFTNECGYNKLALGHNMDDAVETLMMNMVYHGKFSSLPPKLPMFDGRLEIIRPIIKVSKTQTAEYSALYNFPKIKSGCGYENLSQRFKFRQFADNLERMNRGAVKNIFNSMQNINQDYIVK